MALEATNKLAYVYGNIYKPHENSKDLLQLKRCNNMVTSWLLDVVSKTIATSITYLLHMRFDLIFVVTFLKKKEINTWNI